LDYQTSGTATIVYYSPRNSNKFLNPSSSFSAIELNQMARDLGGPNP